MRIYHKFHAKPTQYKGIRYHSKREAQYAAQLDLRVKGGEVLFYLRQVPFQLPTSIYRLDFMEFWADGSVHLVEVKGMETPLGKLKREQVQALYPVEIEVFK